MSIVPNLAYLKKKKKKTVNFFIDSIFFFEYKF
jgi:hypothetical protein